jgi:hypothetical protein
MGLSITLQSLLQLKCIGLGQSHARHVPTESRIECISESKSITLLPACGNGHTPYRCSPNSRSNAFTRHRLLSKYACSMYDKMMYAFVARSCQAIRSLHGPTEYGIMLYAGGETMFHTQHLAHLGFTDRPCTYACPSNWNMPGLMMTERRGTCTSTRTL